MRADAEEEIRRFEKLPCSGLFQCRFRIEKERKEKWPRGRRRAGAVPQIEEKYRLKAEEITSKEKEREEYLQKSSCIVLISNTTKEERGVYSYAWPSVEARERVEPLLKLFKITLDEL